MTIKELITLEQQLLNIQLKLQSYIQGTKDFKTSQDDANLYLSKARDSINMMIKEKK